MEDTVPLLQGLCVDYTSTSLRLCIHTLAHTHGCFVDLFFESGLTSEHRGFYGFMIPQDVARVFLRNISLNLLKRTLHRFLSMDRTDWISLAHFFCYDQVEECKSEALVLRSIIHLILAEPGIFRLIKDRSSAIGLSYLTSQTILWTILEDVPVCCKSRQW